MRFYLILSIFNFFLLRIHSFNFNLNKWSLCKHSTLSSSSRQNQKWRSHKSTTLYGKGFGGGGFSKSSKVTPPKNSKEITTKSTLIATASTIEKHCPTLNLQYSGLRLVHETPPIFEIEHFFSPAECSSYMTMAEKQGHKINSQTFGGGSTRTSTTWYMQYKDVPELLSRANKLTGLPILQYEEPQIVRYETGQQFSFHYDAIPKSLLDSSGQRIATLIVYLNDVSLGGATVFKDLNLQIKPQTGKALLFFPCFADGTPDDRTMHAGQVAGDTKFIAQVWLHQADYSPKLPPGNDIGLGIEAANTLIATST